MQIVGVTDPMQVGFSRQAMVGVRTRGDTRKVADAFAAFDEVDYVVVTAGSFDVLGVESTETFVYLGLRKQTYTWGTRRPELPPSGPAV